MEALFSEKIGLKEVAVPTDINLAGITGSRIKLDKGYGLAIVVQMGDSTGATVTFDLDQHDAAAAGNSKALDIKANYYHKAAGQSAFTKVEVRPDDASLSDSVDLSAVFGDAEGLVVFHVLPEHLDRDGGFAWVSINTAAAGAAKIVSAVYAVSDIKNGLAYEAVL